MYYLLELEEHVRIPPIYFGLPEPEAALKVLNLKYQGHTDPELGLVLAVSGVKEVGRGSIFPGDGAAWHPVRFEIITFRPELHELVLGKIKDIVDFGAFIGLGPIDGMVHISQTMDDVVSFAKEKVLTGKESKRVLKVGDICRARITAISFKDIANPKIGLTMRQPGLGKLEWLEEKPKEKKRKYGKESV